MARPRKQKLDYFPLDTCFDDGVESACTAIKAIDGSITRSTVIGVTILLWQRIYRNGYYLETDEEVIYNLAVHECGIKLSQFKLILSVLLNKGIFDKFLFEKKGVLTGTGVQRRYFEVAKRRNLEISEMRYLLLSDVKKSFLQQKPPLLHTETPIIVSKNPYKGNKSKINKKEIYKEKNLNTLNIGEVERSMLSE